MNDQRLFISHANEDAAVAQRILAYLEAKGAPCWISSRDIPARAIYADAIAEAMQAASACVVIVSAASNESKAVKRELELASHHDKPFIPIRIDSTEPAAGVDYYLRNTQWIDYGQGGERALDRIVAAPRPAAAAPTKAAPKVASQRLTFIIAACILAPLFAAGIYFAMQSENQVAAPPPASIVGANAPSGQAPGSFLVGDYHWDGLACGDGPHVTLDNGDLIFAMPGTPTYRHRIESTTRDPGIDYAIQIQTTVTEPTEHAGETYTFRSRTLRSSTLEVISGGQTDIWERCPS